MQISEKEFRAARAQFADWGIDANEAIAALRKIPLSLHCWQGDDVGGFETARESLSGGIAVTGNYPGRARTPAELRQDLEQALRLIPGRHRLNLHASYGEFGGRAVDRDQIERSHFKAWLQWAREHTAGVDFNPTFFSHRHSESGFTLSHPDKSIREFWIEHGKRSRQIGAWFGRTLGTPCVTNFWIPDGFKDTPVDRAAPRERLIEALDDIFSKPLPASQNRDAVEPKLFGIGSESYTVGSHEFYLSYAVTRKKWLCLDAGHFHPTESIADKISAVAPFVPGLLLHVSRGVRWDSDHVVTLTDELQLIADEIVRSPFRGQIAIGLDYFDATINRIAAWVIGVRGMQKALLRAFLKPWKKLEELEGQGNYTGRLAWQEESKQLPFGAIWRRFCEEQNVPSGPEWLEDAARYERDVLARRE